MIRCTALSDTPYGETEAKTFTPRLIRLSAVAISGVIMTILDTTIVNVAIHTLGRDFHASVATIQWVATGYLLALSLVIPLSGWAIERFGVRRLWFGALVLFVAGSVLSGAAWSAGSLIFFRILQGAAGGIIMPVAQTMLAREAGPSRMGRVMSVIAVPALLGPVLGPVIGGAIVDGISWRWIFYVNVPVGIVALLAAWRWLGEDAEHGSDAPIDAVGIALLSPGLAGFVYGLSEAGNVGFGAPRVLIACIAGLALIAAFVVHALRRRNPLIDVRLFTDRTFAAAGGTTLVFVGTLFAGMLLFPLYEQGRARTERPRRRAPARPSGPGGDGRHADRRQARRRHRPARDGALRPCLRGTRHDRVHPARPPHQPGAAGPVGHPARDRHGPGLPVPARLGLPHAHPGRHPEGEHDDQHPPARRRRDRHRRLRRHLAERHRRRARRDRVRHHVLVGARPDRVDGDPGHAAADRAGAGRGSSRSRGRARPGLGRNAPERQRRRRVGRTAGMFHSSRKVRGSIDPQSLHSPGALPLVAAVHRGHDPAPKEPVPL